MNHRELFDQVAGFLSERGYGWVVIQVREELAAGRLMEERLSTLKEVKSNQARLLDDGDFKRGQQAEFIKRTEYSEKEAVILLLEAARRAILETGAMAENLRVFLQEENLTSVKIEPEEDEEQSPFYLSAGADFDSSAMHAYTAKLDHLIRELRAT